MTGADDDAAREFLRQLGGDEAGKQGPRFARPRIRPRPVPPPGETLPSVHAPRRRATRLLPWQPILKATVLAAILGLLVVIGLNAPQDTPPPSPPDPDAGVRAAGREFAHAALQRVLVAPATAKIPWETVGFSVQPDWEGDPCWLVWGAVDSQNRRGALLRSRWKVVLTRDVQSGRFEAREIRLDGTLIYSAGPQRVDPP